MVYAQDKFDKVLTKLRFVYILLYMAFLALYALTPVWSLLDGSRIITLAYLAIAAGGGLVILLDLIHRQMLFSVKGSLLLALFWVACGISSLANSRYGLYENAKSMIWTAIQLFVMLSIDGEANAQTRKKHLRLFGEVFCAVWTVGACWSFWQFLIQYSGVYHFIGMPYGIRTGFANGRLFGVFSDPNYASLTGIVAGVLAALFMLGKDKKLPGRLWHGFVILIQFCYLILSGSRTAFLVWLAICALAAASAAWMWVERLGKKVLLRLMAWVLAAILGAGAGAMVYVGTQTGLSYLPGILQLRPELAGPTGAEEGADEHKIPSRVDFTRVDVEENSDISNGRGRIWSEYFGVFLQDPIVGLSSQNVNAYLKDRHPDLYISQSGYSVHNGYLSLLVCTGLLGAVPMLLWLILAAAEVLGYLLRNRKRRDETYRTVSFLTAAILALAIGALPLQYIFFSNGIIDLLFWVLLGYTLGFVRMAEPERYAQKPLLVRLIRKLLGKKENDGCLSKTAKN